MRRTHQGLKVASTMDIDLPDCVLSFIFSKLTLKDRIKTCTLSKHWLREWRLSSRHLNFDLHTTFHYNTLPKDLELFPTLQSQFTATLDQSISNYQHPTIHSIRLQFPLGDQHTDVIARLISLGVAKGVKHIQLLLSHETNHADFILKDKIKRYRFSFTLLSSDSPSLTYLHLENCHLLEPTEFYGLKNLTTLVLQITAVDQDFIQGLFSNCLHLVDLTLDKCVFNSPISINSPTLLNLKIDSLLNSMNSMRRIDIVAPNLSSLEYSSKSSHSIYLKAPMLSKFIYRSNTDRLSDISSLKNLTTIVLDGFEELLQLSFMPSFSYLFEQCLQLEDVTIKNCPMPCVMEISSSKLRHLKIIDCCYGAASPSKISIVANNLSSFEYSGYATRKFSIMAPKLSKFFWNAALRERFRNSLGPIPKLNQIENLVIITSHSHISRLKALSRIQNLKQLELYIDKGCFPFSEFFSILDVLMACQHLQKLSLTVRNSSWDGFLTQRKNAKFFHNELKCVELHGCVCNIKTIALARFLLRNVNSLKKITFSSCDKFYIGAERYTVSSDNNGFDRNFIYESLKDEVKEQCQLIIL